MSDPTKKTYAEEMKELFQTLLILVVIGLVGWGVSSLFVSNDTSNVPDKPTEADYKKWYNEYQEYGNQAPDIEINQQYGGR